MNSIIVNPVHARIEDVNGNRAIVNVASGESAALVVATRELKELDPEIKFFSCYDGSIDMNVNVTFGGTPENVHNGTDNVYWTASAITGTWTFDSVDYNHTLAGAKSIKGTETVNGDIAQFSKGSSLTVANYVAITGYIYITAWDQRSSRQINIYGWDTGTGMMIGVSKNIGNYVETTITGSWQKFTIPLLDLKLTSGTIDALRISITSSTPGGPPDFYLDDIRFEETGSPVISCIYPNESSWLHVYSLTFSLADAYTGTLADASMPKIPYDTLLGVPNLENGVIYQRVQNSVVKAQIIVRNLFDFLKLPGSEIKCQGSDGTNTWVTCTYIFPVPVILKDETSDYMCFEVSENLSGLLKFNVSANCATELRT